MYSIENDIELSMNIFKHHIVGSSNRNTHIYMTTESNTEAIRLIHEQ